jgi:large subunit ribosomal protein L24
VSVATIKKNDTVIAVRGVSKGKTGKVLQVDRERGRALVEGVNLVKKAQRKTQANPQGGITEKEASLALANLRPYCPVCKRGVRIHRQQDGDKRVRVCARKGCKHVFDS